MPDGPSLIHILENPALLWGIYCIVYYYPKKIEVLYLSKYKICVYAICKNEEKFVDEWMDSMGEADQVVVTDTGSTDGTVERLRARGAVVHQCEVKPWRFDRARNLSLSHVPDDVDICVCTDLDERFEPGWREKLEEAWRPGTHTANYMYHWSLKPDGSPDVQFVYFKIHTKKDYVWHYPIHECLKYKGKKPEQKVFAEGVILNHYPDDTKSRGSYLPLLEMAVEEEPEDDRVRYYLGREYMFAEQWEKCIATLQQHLALPSAQWAEERCASMRWIAKCYYKLSNIGKAYSWYFRAIAEVPYMREPYVEFAQIAYEVEDWSTCAYMAEKALAILLKSSVYINMGYAWDETPYDLAAIACYRQEYWEKAVLYGEKAAEIASGNERILQNLAFYRAAR